MKQSIYYITVCLLSGLLTSCIDDETVPVENVTNANLPELSDIETKDATASSITITGKVVNHNGYPVTERGIVWGTSWPLNIENDSHKSMTDSNDDIDITADDVKSATLYFICLYAVNKAGTKYGEKKDSIRTESGLGTVETIIFDENTRATTANAGGYITSRGEGIIREYGIYIWHDTPEGKTSKDSIISTTNISERDTFRCNLTNLLPSTIYHIQAYVKNNYGIFTGEVKDLETNSGKPLLSEIKPVTPESNRARVEATVLSIGEATTLIQRGFCWIKSSSEIPTIANEKIIVPISGDGLGDMIAFIQPLDPSQSYRVRAFAENEFGITYSDPVTFDTPSALPSITTLAPINVVNGSAVFGGNLINVGASDVVRIGVCYSTFTTSPGLENATVVELTTPPIQASDIPYLFNTSIITGLRGDTNYYIRAFAINGNGIQYGGLQTIHTPPVFTQETTSFDDGQPCIEGSSAYFTILDKGYLLGGDVGPNYISNLWSFNPSSNKWGEFNRYVAGSMKWMSTAVNDFKVYVLGGLGTGLVAKDDFYSYDAVSNYWMPKPTGPDPAFLRAGFSLNNEVVYVGGMKDTANCEVWSFNVHTNTWMQKTDFPTSQYGGIAVNINNNIYAGLGKGTSGIGYKQLWKSNGALSVWIPEPTGSILYGNVIAGTVFDGKIYVIDKELGMSNKYTIFEYNPLTQDWKKKADLPNSYSWEITFMFTLQNRIFIGFAAGNKVISYDPLWDN